MKSQRYEILSMASMGQIEPEEAERRLAEMGRRRRLMARSVWLLVGSLAAAAAIAEFHLGNRILWILGTAVESLDSLEIFRQIHVFLSRILGR